MSCSSSPKVDELATKVGDISIGVEATDALKSPNAASSPKSISGSPKTKSPAQLDGSPKVGSPKTVAIPKSPKAASPKQASPTTDPKADEKTDDDVKNVGTPKSEGCVFEDNKDGDGKKNDEENETRQPKEQRRSRTGSMRNTRFQGMTTPPFRDNYFKHGEKSESEANAEESDSSKTKKVTVIPQLQHDRPGFFVGRTRRQSEKSTDGGSKKDGDENADKQVKNRRPRNNQRQRQRQRGPPPDMYQEIPYYPPRQRNNYGNYRQNMYQQPQFDQGYNNNYYQGQPFQQRPNFNRNMQQGGFGYPPNPQNYGRGARGPYSQQQQQQAQYPPRTFRNQDNQGFFDQFGGDQPQQPRKRNRKNRSRTSSKRDRTASTASSANPALVSATNANEARDVAIAVQSS